jgi:hypothetical protein
VRAYFTRPDRSSPLSTDIQHSAFIGMHDAAAPAAESKQKSILMHAKRAWLISYLITS